MCLHSMMESPLKVSSHWPLRKRSHHINWAFVLLGFFLRHEAPNICSIFKSRIQDFCWKNVEMRIWGVGGWALNPCRPFIVSASGRRAYNMRHTFFNWAFSRQAHHLAEPWPRVKQSSLQSNVLAGSHLKCVSNCKICTRRRRRGRDSSNLYRWVKKCRLCMFGNCNPSRRLHSWKIWGAPEHTCALKCFMPSEPVLVRLTDTLRHVIMETKETQHLSLAWFGCCKWCPIISSKALTHPGGLSGSSYGSEGNSLKSKASDVCAHKGLWLSAGELTWPSGSRCSSLWCTDRSVCRPDRSLGRLCEYPADISGHRLSLGTETHRVRRMEKQWYSLSLLRMTMHSSCWQTHHASKGLQPLFHTWKPGYTIRGKCQRAAE